jgi:hypothetical protein
MRKSHSFALALGAWAIFASQHRAQAAFTFTLTEVDNDVLITGAGTLNLAELPLITSFILNATFNTSGIVRSGPQALASYYGGVTGPTSFGSAPATVIPNFSSGDLMGISPTNLSVFSGYQSGDFLSNSTTYLNHSFASMGFTPGEYVYTWGSGANADSVTVVSVPEPTTAGLLGLGGIAWFLLRPFRSGTATCGDRRQSKS